MDVMVGTNARQPRVLAAPTLLSAGDDAADRAELHPRIVDGQAGGVYSPAVLRLGGHNASGVAVARRLLHPSRTTMTLTTSAATASAHHNPSASEAARLTRLISASRAATAVRMLSARKAPLWRRAATRFLASASGGPEPR